MKHTALKVTILFSLVGPVSVMAESPADRVNPVAVEAAPAEVEVAAQQAVEALPTAAPAAGAGQVQQQSVPEAAATEVVDSAVVVAEEPLVPEAPSAMEVPGVEMTGVQAVSKTAAADTEASDVVETANNPCPMKGTGMKQMGKGRDGKGMGGMMRGAGCKGKGKGQNKKHEQVVRRLDMIEARMAKMEAMLESLMKR